jgi:hypothetical protein
MWNRRSVSALSAGAVHYNLVRDGNYSERGWSCTLHPHLDWFYPHDGMVARKGPVATLLILWLTLYRRWGLAYPYDWRGFVGPKKKTSAAGLSVFNSSMGLRTTNNWFIEKKDFAAGGTGVSTPICWHIDNRYLLSYFFVFILSV